MLPRYLTPMLRQRLTQIAFAMDQGMNRDEAAGAMHVSPSQLASTMFRLFGASTWPPVIDPKLWALPIEDPAPPTTGGRRIEKRMSDEELAERIARDQAAKRAERDRWLEIEREKYGLPQRRRSIDDMPA
jgi:hypothetical protein